MAPLLSTSQSISVCSFNDPLEKDVNDTIAKLETMPPPATDYEAFIPHIKTKEAQFKIDKDSNGSIRLSRFVSLSDGSQSPVERSNAVRNLGDEIVSINGEVVTGKSLGEVKKMLKDSRLSKPLTELTLRDSKPSFALKEQALLKEVSCHKQNLSATETKIDEMLKLVKQFQLVRSHHQDQIQEKMNHLDNLRKDELHRRMSSVTELQGQLGLRAEGVVAKLEDQFNQYDGSSLLDTQKTRSVPSNHISPEHETPSFASPTSVLVSTSFSDSSGLDTAETPQTPPDPFVQHHDIATASLVAPSTPVAPAHDVWGVPPQSSNTPKENDEQTPEDALPSTNEDTEQTSSNEETEAPHERTSMNEDMYESMKEDLCETANGQRSMEIVDLLLQHKSLARQELAAKMNLNSSSLSFSRALKLARDRKYVEQDPRNSGSIRKFRLSAEVIENCRTSFTIPAVSTTETEDSAEPAASSDTSCNQLVVFEPDSNGSNDFLPPSGEPDAGPTVSEEQPDMLSSPPAPVAVVAPPTPVFAETEEFEQDEQLSLPAPLTSAEPPATTPKPVLMKSGVFLRESLTKLKTLTGSSGKSAISLENASGYLC